MWNVAPLLLFAGILNDVCCSCTQMFKSFDYPLAEHDDTAGELVGQGLKDIHFSTVMGSKSSTRKMTTQI